MNAIVEQTDEANPISFVNFIGVTDASIQWDNIYCAVAGTKNVRFRYALETGTRYLDVYVNGTKVINNAPFTATGHWGTWGETTIQVPMNEGMNSFKVVTTGTEGPNIDNIHVTASN
ncbi:carbohydrate-binding protein [Paenibacillus turicensis]|uniref:carbohydrate-binding protein n=1 Tax=Paenibacillus turicensis TaxID=160487 RepID=UPI003D2B2DF2